MATGTVPLIKIVLDGFGADSERAEFEFKAFPTIKDQMRIREIKDSYQSPILAAKHQEALAILKARIDNDNIQRLGYERFIELTKRNEQLYVKHQEGTITSDEMTEHQSAILSLYHPELTPLFTEKIAIINSLNTLCELTVLFQSGPVKPEDMTEEELFALSGAFEVSRKPFRRTYSKA